MTLTRSGPSLDGLLEALDAWASGQVAHDVAVSLAQAGQGLVRRGFDQSKAPDGSTWAPLKDPRARGRRPLRKTDRLAYTATRYDVDRSGFVMTSTSYGGFHHTGTRRMVARRFYPDDVGPLPVGWEITLSAAAEDALPRLPR